MVNHLISLFNGIGGCFRSYDIASILPMGRVAIDVDSSANRITLRRWPGTIVVSDVKLVDKAMVASWARKFLGITGVHLWGGWPCVDLSAVKRNTLNLAGPQSSLFWDIPRILGLLVTAFGAGVQVKYVLENVAFMEKSAADEITQVIGVTPYMVDCVQSVPMHRPRLVWTSEKTRIRIPRCGSLQY